MNVLKKVADAIEEHPNTASIILGAVIAGIYWRFCNKIAAEAASLVVVEKADRQCITFTPKQ